MIKEVFKPASIEEAVKFKNESNFYLSGGTQINWAPAQADRKINGKPAIEKVILVQDLLSKEIQKQGSDLFPGLSKANQINNLNGWVRRCFQIKQVTPFGHFSFNRFMIRSIAKGYIYIDSR